MIYFLHHMARIYFHFPPWSSFQDCWNWRQCTFLLCGIGTIIIVTLFLQMHSHSEYGNFESSPKSVLVLSNKTEQPKLPHRQDMHYGIVLDCGSSGTRVYVYMWPPHSGKSKDLLNIQQLKDQYHLPVMKKVMPGLDTFSSHPEDASEYLHPLLEYAASHIPQEQHTETLLYILATAGMRLLPEQSQKEILLDLQQDIPKDFKFMIVENNFEVITGKQEGVYAWIAANYVLQKFGHGEEDHPLVTVDIPGENGEITQYVRRRTVGTIDMGGGSMQIAFEITANIDSIPKNLVAEFNLGCFNADIEHTYRVYVSTFLGYGANEARSRYEQHLISQIQKTSKELHILKRAAVMVNYSDPTTTNKKEFYDIQQVKTPDEQPSLQPLDHHIDVQPVPILSSVQVPDPCLHQGLSLPAREPAISGRVVFMGTGDYHKCQESLESLLNLSVPCDLAPCSMNGVHQPQIQFHNSDFFGFSEMWYTMEDVFRIGGQYEQNVFNIHATDFCGKKWTYLQEKYKIGLYQKADEDRFKFQCFKSAWMTTVLHKGLKFPESYKGLISAQYIDDKDVQWTLGAIIHRTRYLPLREIEKMGISRYKPSWLSNSHIIYNQYLLVCFIIVLLAIITYIKRLKLCSNVDKSDMTHVPSLAYFMTDMDQAEQGVQQKMNNYIYP